MKKVMIVDDNVSLQEATARLFLEIDPTIVVQVCFSAMDACRAIESGFQPDVIVSDWDMPGMNGGELCQYLRSAGVNAPFYIVSAIRRDHRSVGADGSALKPVSRDFIKQILQIA